MGTDEQKKDSQRIFEENECRRANDYRNLGALTD